MGNERKSPKLFLQDIKESIELIESYILGKRWEDFNSDIGLQDQVFRRMEIIGEAAKYVSSQMRETTPQIPWDLITDMRNVLIHEYFGIDLRRVWNVVNGPKLKELKENVEKLLQEL